MVASVESISMTAPRECQPVTGALPAPRLQLRWRKPTAKEKKRSFCGCDWTCVYEIVLPLDRHDIRWKKRRPELVKELGRTFVGTDRVPDATESPFRDGAHAAWDSKALGGIPIYIIGADGTAALKQDRSAAA